jgi:hypothetical protein
MKPNELLPDGVDSMEINGQTVRKGTIGAFIQNALALGDTAIDAGARQALEADLLELLPSMKALQVFEVFEIRDPEVRELVVSKLPGFNVVASRAEV